MPVTPVVVVIEDHVELSEVIRAVMTQEGYDVLSVRDQFAAVATLRSQRVDLVVADLPAPEAGRGDPLAEIGRDHPDVPVIAISDAEEDDVPFFGPWRRENSRVILRRPFKLDDLLAVSRQIIDGAVGPASPGPSGGTRNA